MLDADRRDLVVVDPNWMALPGKLHSVDPASDPAIFPVPRHGEVAVEDATDCAERRMDKIVRPHDAAAGVGG